jgi:hypothetical protein
VTTAAEIYEDLRLLSKGFGIHDPQVRRKVGPALRAVCGITESCSHVETRGRLVETLVPMCRALPSGDPVLKLPLVARVALAMEEGYEDQRLGERQQTLAASRHCDVRTVRRRCDYAFQMVSSHLARHLKVGGAGYGQPEEWYLDRFRVFLRLDRGAPEAREERTIISTVDGLSQIANAFSVPRHPDEKAELLRMEVDIEYGGRLVEAEQPTSEYFLHYVELAAPVSRGRSHTYSRIVRLPAEQLMVPRYVFRPLHPCSLFDLRVRFDTSALPSAAWKINAVSEGIYRANRPGRELVRPDRLGEIHMTFDNLHVGLGHGIGWLPGVKDRKG